MQSTDIVPVWFRSNRGNLPRQEPRIFLGVSSLTENKSDHVQRDCRKWRRSCHSNLDQESQERLDTSGLNTILGHVFFFTEVIGAGRLHVKLHFFVARGHRCRHRPTSTRRTRWGRGPSYRRRSRTELRSRGPRSRMPAFERHFCGCAVEPLLALRVMI
jgi:hypothetical protein